MNKHKSSCSSTESNSYSNCSSKNISTNSLLLINKNLQENSDKFFKYISEENIDACKLYFEDIKYQAWNFIDSDGFNPLHKSVNINSLELTEKIIKISKNNLNLNQFNDFINKKSNNGFTPLHYASLKGNMKIIILLIKNGANINLKNNTGLNVLHLCAQGNKPTQLYYFSQKFNMNLSIKDNQGNMPLHWACFFNSDKVLNFLLCYEEININSQNNEGLTPLHLSIVSNNLNAIKKLLIKGADIKLKNKKGENALDIAFRKDKKNIYDLINNPKYKNNNCFFNQYTIVIFYSFHIINPFFIIIFNFPFINKNYFSYCIILYLIWLLFIYCFFILFISINPGIIENNKNKYFSLIELIEKSNIDIDNFCPICKIKYTKYSKHCYICNKCIEEFDHHCVWMGKCVGKKNKKIFYCILILLIFNFLINIFLGILSLFQTNINDYYINFFNFYNNYKKIIKFMRYFIFIINLIITLFSCFIIIPLISFYINNCIKDKIKNINNLKKINVDENNSNFVEFNEQLINNENINKLDYKNNYVKIYNNKY
jgi:palmitoyltransferase